MQLASDPLPGVRRGFALALGMLPAPFLQRQLQPIITTLIGATKVEADPEARDAETRRNAVHGLISVCECIGVCHEDESATALGNCACYK